jgi:hypothetical protein
MWIWDGISGVAALIGLLAGLGGGAFALVEYFDRKEAARAAETLQMIEVWETRGAEQAYLRIANILQDEVTKAKETQQPLEAGLEKVRDKLARIALLGAGADSYTTVTQFFTRLSLCVQARLCSDEVATTFFSLTLSDFRYWFAGEIERVRQTTPSHARELDWLLCKFVELDPTMTRKHAEVPCPTPDR